MKCPNRDRDKHSGGRGRKERAVKTRLEGMKRKEEEKKDVMQENWMLRGKLKYVLR